MKNLLIFLLLIFISIFLFNLYRLFNKSNITNFEPFSENNILFKQEQCIKIKENLPKIEAASAFYPFAATFVQNVYNEDSYSKELFQLVSTAQAFSNVISGKTDIIIATAPSDEQKEMIKKSNVNLEFKTLYLEPLIIFLNKKINDKDYPLLFDVYLIYRVDNNNENISKIVNWIETEEGKSFIDNILQNI